MIFMHQAVEGYYDNGKLSFNEPIQGISQSKVLVVFLEDEAHNVNKENLLSLCGSWKDNKTAEEIIDDIYSSRNFGKENIKL